MQEHLMLDQTERRPLRLHFASANGSVLVAEDRRRIASTIAGAAHACRQAENSSGWTEQFQGYLGELHRWCAQRAEAVEACYVAWGEGGLTVYVVTIAHDYQFDLDDDLHELDRRLAQAYPDCPSEVLQLPGGSVEELMSFFSPESSVQVYGDAPAASPEG
jgi:hypothetical protein